MESRLVGRVCITPRGSVAAAAATAASVYKAKYGNINFVPRTVVRIDDGDDEDVILDGTEEPLRTVSPRREDALDQDNVRPPDSTPAAELEVVEIPASVKPGGKVLAFVDLSLDDDDVKPDVSTLSTGTKNGCPSCHRCVCRLPSAHLSTCGTDNEAAAPAEEASVTERIKEEKPIDGAKPRNQLATSPSVEPVGPIESDSPRVDQGTSHSDFVRSPQPEKDLTEVAHGTTRSLGGTNSEEPAEEISLEEPVYERDGIENSPSADATGEESSDTEIPPAPKIVPVLGHKEGLTTCENPCPCETAEDNQAPECDDEEPMQVWYLLQNDGYSEAIQRPTFAGAVQQLGIIAAAASIESSWLELEFALRCPNGSPMLNRIMGSILLKRPDNSCYESWEEVFAEKVSKLLKSKKNPVATELRSFCPADPFEFSFSPEAGEELRSELHELSLEMREKLMFHVLREVMEGPSAAKPSQGEEKKSHVNIWSEEAPDKYRPIILGSDSFGMEYFVLPGSEAAPRIFARRPIPSEPDSGPTSGRKKLGRRSKKVSPTTNISLHAPEAYDFRCAAFSLDTLAELLKRIREETPVSADGAYPEDSLYARLVQLKEKISPLELSDCEDRIRMNLARNLKAWKKCVEQIEAACGAAKETTNAPLEEEEKEEEDGEEMVGDDEDDDWAPCPQKKTPKAKQLKRRSSGVDPASVGQERTPKRARRATEQSVGSSPPVAPQWPTIVAVESLACPSQPSTSSQVARVPCNLRSPAVRKVPARLKDCESPATTPHGPQIPKARVKPCSVGHQHAGSQPGPSCALQPVNKPRFVAPRGQHPNTAGVAITRPALPGRMPGPIRHRPPPLVSGRGGVAGPAPVRPRPPMAGVPASRMGVLRPPQGLPAGGLRSHLPPASVRALRPTLNACRPSAPPRPQFPTPLSSGGQAGRVGFVRPAPRPPPQSSMISKNPRGPVGNANPTPKRLVANLGSLQVFARPSNVSRVVAENVEDNDVAKRNAIGSPRARPPSLAGARTSSQLTEIRPDTS